MGRRSFVLVALVLVGLALWKLALARRPMPEEQPSDRPAAPAEAEIQRDARPETDRATPIEPTADVQENKPANQESPAASPQAPATPQQREADPTPLPPPRRSGPVAELKQAFEEEPRDSAAHDPESRIESEFRRSDIAPGTMKSVLCRQSVCKVEVVWTPQRALSFMAAFTRLSADFEPGIAIDPHSTDEPLQVDVYLPRRGS